jgi:hypothetical protein
MGFFINNGDFAPGRVMSFGPLDSVTDPAGHLTSAIAFVEGHVF